MPTCITPTSAQSCAAPTMTNLPICKLSLTGCMDANKPTSFASNAVYYEVNSPLWSDGAAKTRAFVLPAGGKIHVKDCSPDAGAADVALCTSPCGGSAGPASSGDWAFPVGTVMIKNFMFDGKFVETRLLMHVDAATALLIGNGTDWVGYNYAWNAAQTEAVIVPSAGNEVMFNTGTRTVDWHYPGFSDCIGCHSQAVGTIGPSNAQMNRTVNAMNQIDAFKAMNLFDNSAPSTPYAAPLAEPYVNAQLGLTGTPGATTDQMARSYLATNCGFCHRPDVNDQGFDLRAPLSLFETKICGLQQQSSIPGMTGMTFMDFAPGDHKDSAMWLRMSAQPGEGRMPPLASFVVDTQATTLIATWIDSIKTCPGADGGL